MELATLSEIAKIAQSFFTVIAIIAGSTWGVYKYRKYREYIPCLALDVNIEVLSRIQDKILVEITAIIKNNSSVMHRVKDFSFDLHYLTEDDKISDGDERINHQVLLSNKNLPYAGTSCKPRDLAFFSNRFLKCA